MNNFKSFSSASSVVSMFYNVSLRCFGGVVIGWCELATLVEKEL